MLWRGGELRLRSVHTVSFLLYLDRMIDAVVEQLGVHHLLVLVLLVRAGVLNTWDHHVVAVDVIADKELDSFIVILTVVMVVVCGNCVLHGEWSIVLKPQNGWGFGPWEGSFHISILTVSYTLLFLNDLGRFYIVLISFIDHLVINYNGAWVKWTLLIGVFQILSRSGTHEWFGPASFTAILDYLFLQ